jgi:hypothetical protein
MRERAISFDADVAAFEHCLDRVGYGMGVSRRIDAGNSHQGACERDDLVTGLCDGSRESPARLSDFSIARNCLIG